MLGAPAQVRELVFKTSMKIRDIDTLTTDQEIRDAIKALLSETEISAEEFRVTHSRPNIRERRLAIVKMKQENANALIKNTKIKIGYVNCQAREWFCVPRCFKCLGYSLQSSACKGTTGPRPATGVVSRTTRARSAVPKAASRSCVQS